jgi:hypothetical protein
VNGAGAALCGIAAYMGAGEFEVLSNELNQQHPGVDGGTYLLAVDRDRNRRSHVKSPFDGRSKAQTLRAGRQ